MGLFRHELTVAESFFSILSKAVVRASIFWSLASFWVMTSPYLPQWSTKSPYRLARFGLFLRIGRGNPSAIPLISRRRNLPKTTKTPLFMLSNCPSLFFSFDWIDIMTAPSNDPSSSSAQEVATLTATPDSPTHQDDLNKKSEGLLSALGTTALVSILLSWAVMVAYFSYFPPVPKTPPQPKVIAVDMMMVGVTIAQMTNFDETKTKPLFDAVQHKLSALRDQGVIVLDVRSAVALPPNLVLEPQDLIPNVPEEVIKRNQAVAAERKTGDAIPSSDKQP